MDALRRDVRYALRRLGRSPAFTVVALLSLALGIGANTAVFSLVNAVVLRETPVASPEELVDVYTTLPGLAAGPMSFPDVRDLREQTAGVFEGVGAVRLALIPAGEEGEAEMLPSEVVTGNYFPLLGLDAAVGRTFTADDDVAPGAHPVAMLGYEHWQSRFDGDPDVVGREIRLAGRPYTVVGVSSPEYGGSLRGLTPAIFIPAMMVNEIDGGGFDNLDGRGNQSWFVKARMADGVGMPRVRAALDRVAGELRTRYPEQWTGDRAFSPYRTTDVVINPSIDRVLVPAFGLLLAVVGVVLLIACANLASFLLARAVDRRREIALRLALGARRWTLVRQLLTETTLLAVLGGALGLVVATWLLRALVAADLPLPLPVTLDLSLDGTVLAFTAGVSLAAGILFGLAPATQATSPDVAPTLKSESGTGPSQGAFGLRNLLVVGQVALSLSLLVGAGLLLRSLSARQDVDPGFGDTPAALVTLSVDEDDYPTAEEVALYFDDLERRVEAERPGVRVGWTTNVHLNTLNSMTARVTADGVPNPAGSDFHVIDRAAVDADYFDAVGIDLVRGRLFGPGDTRDGAGVAVVNTAFVERFWPGEDGVGRTVRNGDTELEIVGVVETAKIRTLGEPPTPFLYLAADQTNMRYATLVGAVAGGAEGGGDAGTVAEALVGDVVREARELEPGVLVFEARTLERHLAVMILPHRLSAVVAGVFAAVALILATLGLYGVVSYAVARRTREVGIRMSLGAGPGRVVRLLMGGGLRLAAAGAGVGLVLAVVFARVLGRFLYGISAFDPWTFVGVPVLLLAVAALAAWIPARKATRVSPSSALRAE